MLAVYLFCFTLDADDRNQPLSTFLTANEAGPTFMFCVHQCGTKYAPCRHGTEDMREACQCQCEFNLFYLGLRLSVLTVSRIAWGCGVRGFGIPRSNFSFIGASYCLAAIL